ncbi:hypothetical protein G7046_g1051 [Stylonectria norvegica]|nr:hypothetical protein G7046_g1051 [Stylonectria norvegica]
MQSRTSSQHPSPSYTSSVAIRHYHGKPVATRGQWSQLLGEKLRREEMSLLGHVTDGKRNVSAVPGRSAAALVDTPAIQGLDTAHQIDQKDSPKFHLPDLALGSRVDESVSPISLSPRPYRTQSLASRLVPAKTSRYVTPPRVEAGKPSPATPNVTAPLAVQMPLPQRSATATHLGYHPGPSNKAAKPS